MSILSMRPKKPHSETSFNNSTDVQTDKENYFKIFNIKIELNFRKMLKTTI